MFNNRKDKFFNKDNQEVNPYSGLTLDLDINALNILCSFVISENAKKPNLANLRELIEKTDIEKTAGQDPNKLNKLKFIKKGLEARLIKKYDYKAIVLSYINGGIGNDTILPESNLRDLNDNEINWITSFVSEKLKNFALEKGIDNLVDACNKFKSANYSEKDMTANAVVSAMNGLTTSIRHSVEEDYSNDQIISLSNGIFESSVKNAYAVLSDPGNKLRTGMKGLNSMLCGGFESERVYCFFGLPGEGKSNLLINLAYQLKTYNRNYNTKDHTKIPCIVLLTMENGANETLDRLICSRLGFSIEEFTSAEELISRSRVEGGLCNTPANPIDIIIKFVPGMSVSTDYMYTLYDKLEDNGYEPICFIQDYLKRIRSSDLSCRDDLRKELGSIVNEMKTFAQDKHIPLITASQFNRAGIGHIDESRKNNNVNNVNQLGRDNIGESNLLLENLDAVIYIVPEDSSDKSKKYMGFELKKKRYHGRNALPMFFQPFRTKDGIALEEDEDTQYIKYKTTLDSTIRDNSDYKGSIQIGFNQYGKYGTTNMNNSEIPKSKDSIESGFVSVASDYMEKNNQQKNNNEQEKPKLMPVFRRLN